MKVIILVGAMLIGISTTVSSPAAEAVSPDIFQTTVAITIPANENNARASVVTTPSDKRLVIQTVSFYTFGGASGSSTRVFLETSIFNVTTFWSVPEVYNDGLGFPSTTLSSTFYAGAGATVTAIAYRDGDLTSSEDVAVSISGYYVARP